MPTVDISSLQTTAKIFQKDLQMLPYYVMKERLGYHGITLFPNVQHQHILTEFYRKQGIAKPYDVSKDVSYSDIGKAIERPLTVHKAYASVVDNINNYKTISVGPDVLLGKNKSKKHPWERTMLESIVRTFGEDILDALFPAQRDVDNQTPLGLFDGFNKLIADAISSGEIAANKGNYQTITDGISYPSGSNDTAAFDKLLNFWRNAHPLLKRANTLLLVPHGIWEAYNAAFFNKYLHKPTVDDWQRTLLEGSGGKCSIVPSIEMGTGQRIILTVPGNMDFGMETIGDEDFVQVRTPFEDPNKVQFWIQGTYGCRIRHFHAKMFCTNTGTPSTYRISGDYS